MKKLVLLFLPLLLQPPPAASAQVLLDYASGSTTPSTELPVPVRDVEYLANGDIRVTYTFSGALLSVPEGTVTKNAFLWQIAGFGNSTSPSNAAVPMRIDSFMIPEGKTVTVRAENIVTQKFNHSMVKGIAPICESAGNFGPSRRAPEIELPDLTFRGSTVYPVDNVKLSEVQDYRGVEIANVLVCPVQSNSLQLSTIAATKLSYVVSFTDSPSNAPAKKKEEKHWRIAVEDLFVLNNSDPGMNDGNNGSTGPTGTPVDNPTPGNPIRPTSDLSNLAMPVDKTYVILTTNALKTSTESFAEWKKMQGYNVVTLSAASWTYDSAKTATDAVFDQYPDIYHLLIVGGATDVPGKKVESVLDREYNYHLTDYYYSLYGDDETSLPAISVGRIPLDAPVDVEDALKKIEQYERASKVTVGSSPSKVICVASFPETNGYEKQRFTKTSEEIICYMDRYTNLSTERIYYAEPSSAPTNWATAPYSFGEPIPDYLKRPNFLWNGNANDIRSGLKATSIISYRSCGDVNGWNGFSFLKPEIESLTNTKLPFIYSICCLTGRYNEPENFVAEMLKTSLNRSCGIIAASSKSYGIYNDEFAEALIDAQWPKPGLLPQFTVPTGKTAKTPIGLSTIGEIFNQALKRTGERLSATNKEHYSYLKEIYHIFGDPSMSVHTALVDASSFATITRNDNSVDWETTLGSIRVSLTRNAYIGLYNKTTGESKRYYGRFLNYFPSKGDDWVVTVYDANVKPLISQNFNGLIKPGIDFPIFNPTTNSCAVKVDTEGCEDVDYSLEVRDSFGNVVGSMQGTGAEKEYIPMRSQSGGVHIVSLLMDGNIVDSKHFIK